MTVLYAKPRPRRRPPTPRRVRVAPATVSAVASAVVALLAFWLSFAALSELAAMYGIPEPRAYAVPLIVDGLVVSATVGAATMTRRSGYAWFLLITGTAVSVAGNGIHAWILTQSYIGVGIAVLPPLVNLAAIHLTITLLQQDRDTATPSRDTAPATVHAEPAPVARLRVAPAPAVQAPAPPATPETPAATSDDQLRDYALDRLARGMSIRATAAELGVSKDRVARWKAAHTATPATVAA